MGALALLAIGCGGVGEGSATDVTAPDADVSVGGMRAKGNPADGTDAGAGTSAPDGRVAVGMAPDASTTAGDALPPGLSLAPLTHDFGTVVIGGQSAPIEIILRNNTRDDVVVTVEQHGGDYAISKNGCNEINDTTGGGTPGVLAMWRCGVSVRFAPTADGTRTGSLVFSAMTSDGMVTMRSSFTGVGTIAPKRLPDGGPVR